VPDPLLAREPDDSGRASPRQRRGPREPFTKYIRRIAKTGKYQVRIPLDGSGRFRVNLGSDFPDITTARIARNEYVRKGRIPSDQLPPWVVRTAAGYVAVVRATGKPIRLGPHAEPQEAFRAAITFLVDALGFLALPHLPPDCRNTIGAIMSDRSSSAQRRRWNAWRMAWGERANAS
jgi:hypothetical protein